MPLQEALFTDELSLFLHCNAHTSLTNTHIPLSIGVQCGGGSSPTDGHLNINSRVHFPPNRFLHAIHNVLDYGTCQPLCPDESFVVLSLFI